MKGTVAVVIGRASGIGLAIAREFAGEGVHLVLFVPNRVPKPVPTFLLICNRDPENIDPTRTVKSDVGPAEEVISRGYGIAAFHNADVVPDRHDGFKAGIYSLLDGETRPPDAWATIAAWAWGASRLRNRRRCRQ